MNLPDRLFLTRGEILKSNLGITRRALSKAIDVGALEPHVWPGNKWQRFLREDVLRVFKVNERSQK